jgi:hypothetical protein
MRSAARTHNGVAQGQTKLVESLSKNLKDSLSSVAEI